MFTFDHKISGHNAGQSFGTRIKTHDGKFADSTGAFLLGELERLDPKVHEPLILTSYGRDIDFREDVSIADDFSSFTVSNIAASGSLGDTGIGRGKSWAGKNGTQIPGVSVDITKMSTGLNLWAQEVAYTIIELESAAKLGRPIDQQQISALNQKYEMDSDEQVYIGDLTLNIGGLLNSTRVSTVTNFVNGAAGFSTWKTKTPDEVLADFSTAISTVWAASGWKIKPTRILIPPAQFGDICMRKVATASGLVSIKKYVEDNNLITATGEGALQIEAAKYCIGAGVGGTIGVANTVDRMVVYTKNPDLVRFPRTPLQKTPIQYAGLYHKSTYFGKLGGVEFVYPETIGYFDGL